MKKNPVSVNSWGKRLVGRSFSRRLALESALISLVTWFGGPTPSAAQSNEEFPAGPPIVYVSNAGGGITEVNATNNSVIATAPFANNANSVAVTPDGRRMYVSNRDVGQVTVFDTQRNVPVSVIPVGNGNDNLGLAISPDGSLVYVANQFSGTVTVIATASNAVVKTIPTGVEPIWITFSADGSRAYVSNQVSGTISVVATASQSVLVNIGGFSCPFESAVTRDGSKLLVSSQCDNSLKVVNLATNAIANSISTGPNPRGIALTPDGARAYVADWFSNTVEVIDVYKQVNLNTPITVGLNPWGMAMTPAGKAYTANFGDGTISVIDSATNTVTATLPARGNPEDVTVSTTARPQILNYSFKSFDPPGSVDTVPRGVNSVGQNVGSFKDGGGVTHGYLRQADGAFVTLDPPGSVATFATGINDFGTIAGEWQAASGALHGFLRSPSGIYTTVDFPGAVDTGLEDVNDYGNLSGVFDLGDQTTNIGFTNIHGSFLSFEDPSAAPMQTSAGGMNALGFIAGNYVDPSGSTHGFVRTPTGQFDNFDFPGADTTLATRLNDYGQAVGQYFTNFPSHGFLLNGATALNVPPSPCQLLSFDYPNSQNSATRGVNNRGQVSGFYRVWGDPARHGFLATPASGDGGDGNNSCASTLSLIGRGSVNFASFDYPGSANTQATAITPSEEIVGRYFSADGKQHGFILRRGQFQAVDVPQAFFTDVTWVNARGDIVGSYADAIGSHAYVLSGGKVTTIDFPGGNVNLTGFGISNAGDVVGVKSVGSDFLHGHGYLFSRGAFTQIDVPGAQGTFPTMILDPSRIVGAYVDSDSLFHGFVLTNGQFRTIDFPNSTFTWITGISPEGDLVGFYNSQDGVQHGFVQRDGKFISVDVPGASSTEGNGINAQGNVVGRYISADGKTHGYFFECVTCQNHGAKGQMNGFRVQILSGPLRFMQRATIERRTN